ncbi:MAG TPA: TonB family protein [Polyangiaceae bacterium]|nr:TonB family protein [Polyangiaceae bacterium]
MKRLRFIPIVCAALIPFSAVASAQPQNEPSAPSSAPTPPKLLESVAPVYPEARRASAESASVGLVLTIDETGHVSDAVVSESAGEEFDQAALDAARKTVFEPAMRDGKPVAARIPFRFEFKLEAPEPTPAPAPAPAAPKEQKPAPAPAAAAELEELDIAVEGERPPREPTKRTLEAEEIRKIPGTNGDALRSIGNMPGVARPPGMDGLLLVRGSSPRDSQIFIDGTNVPIVYHFGGLSSVVPSEILERIDFYPGNFGPQYGRATGGIVDVAIRSPRKDRLGGLLQVDTVDGRILAEGPLSDSTRFMLGGRRSWLDVWLGPALESGGVGVTTAPRYYDYQAMLEHDVSSDTSVRLFAFGSDDRMVLTLKSPDSADPALGGDALSHLAFWRVQGRVDTRPTNDVRWTTTLSVGNDQEQTELGDMMIHTDAFNLQARSDVRMKLSPEFTAVAGIDVQRDHYDVTINMPPVNFDDFDTSGPLFGRTMTRLHADDAVTRPAAYAMLEVSPFPALKLFPGVRADFNQDTGDWTADPRLGVRYDVHAGYPRTTLKGGVGLFHKPPEPYESVEPFGTPGVGSESATHYSLGFEQEFSRPLELSVEGFYKDLNDLVVAVPAADTTQNGFEYDNVGSGRTYGAEMLLRYKPVDRFFGWVAYTLSRSERQNGEDQPTYRYDFDQTHILTALGSYKLGRGWELGARFRYVTGRPYTPKLGGVMDYDAGVYSPIESPARNSRRLEAFHALDVRVEKTWKFQDWSLSGYVDVQNVYNQKNVEALSDNFNYSQTTPTYGLPILPIIGIRGEL